MIPCNQNISLGWVDIAVETDLMDSEQFLSSVAIIAIIANKCLFSRCVCFSGSKSLSNQTNGGMV